MKNIRNLIGIVASSLILTFAAMLNNMYYCLLVCTTKFVYFKSMIYIWLEKIIIISILTTNLVSNR